MSLNVIFDSGISKIRINSNIMEVDDEMRNLSVNDPSYKGLCHVSLKVLNFTVPHNFEIVA